MKYVIDIHEAAPDEPEAVRYWASVQNLGGCFIAENSLDELFASAPGVITAFIEVANERGAKTPLPTEFEFRRLVHA
jgi:predicted RNase H-like HicB family nuclease